MKTQPTFRVGETRREFCFLSWTTLAGESTHDQPFAYFSRVRVLISDVKVRWTGHFSAISSTLSRCSLVRVPVSSISLSIWSMSPTLVSQLAQSSA